MAGLVSRFKSAIGFGSDSSQSQTDETIADSQPLALDASKVSADFKKVVGVGSLGTVYTGKFMEKKCAIKIYNVGVVQKEALQICEIASIIQHHPNVVLVHGLWYGSPANTLPNNDPALVMEHCSVSLDGYLTEIKAKGGVAAFRFAKKQKILSDVASGMAYLHSKEIVHGGLSAKKVLLNFTGPSDDQTILAKVAGVHEMKLFQDTVMTPSTSEERHRIMPPEVKNGGGDVELTKPVDLFSFGCLIAHVVSCVNPVPSMEAGLNEFQKRSQCIPKSQPLFEPLMKRCLDESPVARGTFEDMEKDLSAHQSKYGGKQAQKLEEQTGEVNGRREAETFKSAVDQPKVHNLCTAEASSSPKPAAEVSSPKFLHLKSVSITHKKQWKEGSFAKLYRGEYEGRPCAVKVYKEDVLKGNVAPGPTDKHHIALTAAKHTNIVQMYGIWYHQVQVYHKSKMLPSIVMEICEESLRETIKKWKKTPPTDHKEKLLIQRDITEGMVYLHDLCIIHGNLHSGNVLLCHYDDKIVAKVSDFDMSYRDPNTQSRLTNKFTADENFLPPEVLDCKNTKEKWAKFTPKVDVFCFGELALEMALGSYPTPDKKMKGRQTQTEVQRRQSYLTKLEKSNEENLNSIIQKCFSDTPEGRPSFTDILSDTDRHLQKYGEWPECAMLQDRTVESEALGGQALGKTDSKSSSDMQERKKDLRSGYPQQVIYDTSVDLPPLVPETSHVPADRASSLDVGLLSKATPDPFPFSLESSLVTYDDMKAIGQGSFATVYRGKYKEQKCAIKVFKKGMVRFLKCSKGESQLASIVRHHPNVVLVHGLLHIANRFPDDQPALVMELCNTTLRAYLQGKVDKGEDESFETPAKSVVLRDIAAGMIYLHTEQIVHGDLTANNVLLNVTGSKVVAKVAGFGQSGLLINAQTVITNSARHDIMPPEVNGSQNQLPTKAIDVFSFGCLILHVSSCFYPDLGTDCQVGTSEFQKRVEKYISESEKHVFCVLVKRCLEKIPEDRGTFEEVIVHLNKYLKREQVQIVEEGHGEIQKLRSQLLQLQRALDNMQEELAAKKETCSKAQRRGDALAKELQEMEQKLNDVMADNEQHRSLAVEGIFKTYAAPKDEMKRLEDQVKEHDSDMERLQQQHTECLMKCDKYCRENSTLQNEVKTLSRELETLQREKGGIMGEKNVIEELKQKADKNVTELQNQLQACRQKCEKTERELKDSNDRVRQLTTDVSTKSNMVSQLEEDVASRDRQLRQTKASKERADKEREAATLEREQAKKETEKLKEEFEKERRTLQAKISSHEKANSTQQEKLSGARKKEQTLNDQLREYRDKLKTTEGARDRFERSMVALKEEVAARDKQVRELTTELALRNGDLDKKEKELFTTKKDLVDAQAAVEEGKSLEPKLREKIEELEDKNRELMDDLEKTLGKLKNVQKKLTEAMDTQNVLENEREQQDETIRELEGVRDRLSDRVQTLESELSEKEAFCEELEKKRHEEAQNCQLMERERDHAREQADEVRRQAQELYKEHDSLRIAHTQAQQGKMNLSKQVMEYEQQMKAERAATAKERDSISLELVALRQEKRHLEENLEAKHQDLMSKQEELNVAESYVLGLQQRIEDLQEEYEVLQSDRQEKVHKLNELAPRCEEVERQHAEEAEKCRFWKGEYDRFALTVGHLERTRSQMEAHTQELEKQQIEEAEKCHRLKDERDSALKKADNLREQLDALHKDIATLRKTLQNKTELILKLRQSQEEMKAKLTATEQERDSTSLELVALRQGKGRVEEHLEATSQELMVSVSKCNKLESSREKLECLFTEMATKNEALQEQLDEATEKCHAMESECKRLTSSVEELETELNDVTVRSEELREQLDDKLEMCRLMERGRAIELQRAEELQKQRDEMYRDHELLRKKLNADLQKKMDLIQELAQSEQQMKTARDNAINRAGDLEKQLADLHMDHEKLRGVQVSELQGKTNLIEELMESERQNEADLISADRDYQALKAKLEATAEDASKDKTSLVRVSSELEAMKRDLENSEKQLEDARQCLKEKVEECKAFESTQLQLLPNMEDLKRENQQLAVQVMQKEAELATLVAERSALCGQLKDFAVIKAENESLKNDAEERAEMMRQCEEKSRRLAKREERLNKEKMALTTERRLVMKQRKQMDTEFVRSRDLESIVKSFQESCAERAELRNASGREMSKSGSSEGSPDSSLLESPRGRGDLQNISAIEEGKREVEEALRQKEREIQHIQHQLDRARQDIKQLKDAERKAQDSSEEMHELAQTYDAERKAQGSSEEMHKLAQTYFLSHRYPPFLYQLHQLQKHLHSSGVQGISTLGDGRAVEVTRVTNLRSFTPNESWCDEFRSLIDELKAMPSKQCQAYMLISFLHCGEVITFYRFHVALVPQVLSCERDLHPNELEGDAMPKAMLVYAQTELKSNNLKEFGITPHRKGVLLQPQCEGYVPELTRSQLLRKLKDTPAGLKHTEECLDANILHQLQRQYREFAKPRTAHRGPPMGVAMALI